MNKLAGEGSIEHSSSLLNLKKQSGISDHPLAEKEYQDHDLEETSSYTESLLQSAVKSVVNSTTSIVSDDEDSFDSGRPRSSLTSPSLRSLQTKTIPAFPDEDDRKRFVGCLAAILASAYDYDVSGEDDTAEHSMGYFDVHGDDEDNEDEYLSERDIDADLSSCYSSSHDIGDLHTTVGEYKSLLTPLSSETIRPSHSKEPLNGTPRSTSASTTPTQSLHGTGSNLRSQPSMHELWNRRDAHREKRALQRHRRRRYEILTDFLVKSAELLLLEPAQSRAFVPMLSKVLVPPKTSDKRKAADRRESDNEETKSELDDKTLIIRELDEDDVLRPFLESMKPGSGFRCLSLLLLQHLLRSSQGYDARVRHVLKKLGTIIFVHEMERDSENLGPEDKEWNRRVLMSRATRKYESLEHTVALRILELSAVGQDLAKLKGSSRSPNGRFKVTLSRDHVVRGLKIGGAGLVAGGLMAITGGLAAPAIAAGMAALAGGTASAALVALTSTAAVTSIFGVGGAGLVAYKMQRRTKGLTEFEFRKESSMMRREDGRAESSPIEAELFTTICISGWLRDYCDFQRPWGLTPTNPRISDGVELLERFYSVHKPDHVPKSQDILKKWAGEERHLWKLLKEKYGCNPDHLFPLEHGPRYRASLSLDQKEVIANLFIELGYAAPPSEQHGAPTPFEKMRNGFTGRFRKPQPEKKDGLERLTFADLIDEVQNAPFEGAFPLASQSHAPNLSATTESSMPQNQSANNEQPAFWKPNGVLEPEPPLHLTTVWDYKAHYGGELYTVKWESHVLMELCNSVEDMAMDIVSNATQHILKATIFAALLTSVALPIAIVKTANMIDGTWTIAIERADMAGKELAKSLLFSRAGQRPITLVGYSMGARTIYACLKELSKYQERWEDERESQAASEGSKNGFKANAELENMREPASIVEDVILMGTPNHLSVRSWKACRQIVSGRLVNCYSRKDLILSLMFQYKRLSFKKVCGTCAIDIPGVENVDVSDLVTGHHLYCIAAGDILKRVGHGQAVRGPRNLELQEDETKADQLSDVIPDVKIHYR